MYVWQKTLPPAIFYTSVLIKLFFKKIKHFFTSMIFSSSQKDKDVSFSKRTLEKQPLNCTIKHMNFSQRFEKSLRSSQEAFSASLNFYVYQGRRVRCVGLATFILLFSMIRICLCLDTARVLFSNYIKKRKDTWIHLRRLDGAGTKCQLQVYILTNRLNISQ